jgi:hypothetical protein
MQEAKNSKGNRQGTLDGMLKAVKAPQQFTREGVLGAVARFIACNDEVSLDDVLR